MTLKLEVPRLPQEELKGLVRDRLSGAVMFSSEVREDMVSMVFGCGMLLPSLSPPNELLEEHLGSSSPPESLEGEPPKPEHPGYPEETAGDPPVKPVLARVPEETEIKTRWGWIPEETYREILSKVEAENQAKIDAWLKATDAWQDALKEDDAARARVDQEHERALKAWGESLPAHAEAVAAREKAKEVWEARHREVFGGWFDDVGVLVGRTKDAAPRAINGLPIFYSIQIIHREDWSRIEAAIHREQSRDIAV